MLPIVASEQGQIMVESQLTAQAFVATHPIFDRNLKVHAYDLDFPSGFASACNAAVTDHGAADPSGRLDLDGIVGSAKAHIVFSRRHILMDLPVLFPPERLIVGVPDSEPEDRELAAACRRMADLGYEFTVPYVEPDSPGCDLLGWAGIVRMDAGKSGFALREACARLAARGIHVLAGNLQRGSDFSEAAAAGCRYFQGGFYRRPVRRSGSGRRDPPLAEVRYLQLLEEVNRPDQPLNDLAALIRQDVALAFRLLRFVNSAWFGFKTPIKSIRHALVLLGPPEVKKWASTLVLSALGDEKPRELFRRSLLRARMAERVASKTGLGQRANEAFLMGMFSLADALTDTPLAQLLGGLPLTKDVAKALLAERGELGPIHGLVGAYEQGRWPSFFGAAAALGLDDAVVPGLFAEASRWADTAMLSM